VARSLHPVILAWTQTARVSTHFGFVPRRTSSAVTSWHSSLHHWSALDLCLPVVIVVPRPGSRRAYWKGTYENVTFRYTTQLSALWDAVRRCLCSATDSEHDGLGPGLEKH
jgi:hypothetical protein